MTHISNVYKVLRHVESKHLGAQYGIVLIDTRQQLEDYQSNTIVGPMIKITCDNTD